MTYGYIVPEADRHRMGGNTWGFEQIDLAAGPRVIPDWCNGARIEWRWPFGNRPSIDVRCRVDPLKGISAAPVWRRIPGNGSGGVAWLAEKDGVAECHYHSGAISVQQFEDHVRWIDPPSVANNFKGKAETRPYSMLATTQQDGYGGRHFDITLAAQELPVYDHDACRTSMVQVEAGTKLRLRGPWHSTAPAGFSEVSYYIDKPEHRGARRMGRPMRWHDHTGFFGLLLKTEAVLDIMATYCPEIAWAAAHSTRDSKPFVGLEPLNPATGLPKHWFVHPSLCPGHEFAISPFAPLHRPTSPNDRCNHCNTPRGPNPSPFPPPKVPPLYFRPYLEGGGA